jgi:hypothetical protein
LNILQERKERSLDIPCHPIRLKLKLYPLTPVSDSSSKSDTLIKAIAKLI